MRTTSGSIEESKQSNDVNHRFCDFDVLTSSFRDPIRSDFTSNDNLYNFYNDNLAIVSSNCKIIIFQLAKYFSEINEDE